MSFHMEPTLALVKENEEFLSSLFAGSGEGLVVTGTDMLSPATLSVWGVCRVLSVLQMGRRTRPLDRMQQSWDIGLIVQFFLSRGETNSLVCTETGIGTVIHSLL